MRTIVVLGGAADIGKATADAFRARACHVITVDKSKADVVADLSTQAGRDIAIGKIKRKAEGRIDAIIVGGGSSTGDPEAMVGLIFFAATYIVEGLRSLLQASSTPRVVFVSCEAIIHPHDLGIVDACLARDEDQAKAAAASAPDFTYASSKLALSYWVKQQAVRLKWAGIGILMNAVAPREGRMQMSFAGSEDTAAAHRVTLRRIGRSDQPNEAAALIVFLASPENTCIVGQTIFCDGGAEAALRPHHV
ncbi:SDR family oxidoreductase [Pseudomonas sp. CG7]|uniref:SDR family oxidoreductase n=1 Tax=Pseudomonas sp. CG7 TaxID=191007 RepID=UPI00203416F0|nr:SDR family oxidoreductase [Pseudomonas sp. CG7]MCM2459338.1 SDR family oxidoreductase [Pseudomonas sp. CG7]